MDYLNVPVAGNGKYEFKTPDFNGYCRNHLNSHTPHTPYHDRFISNREQLNLESSYQLLSNKSDKNGIDEISSDTIKRKLFDEPALSAMRRKKVLSLSCRPDFALTPNNCALSRETFKRELEFKYFSGPKAKKRRMPTRPDLVLDAPEVNNDFYLNLLDWSSSNKLAICLGNDVYSYDQKSKVSVHLFSVSQLNSTDETDDELYFCSVSWMRDGHTLAAGISNGVVQLWDVNKEKLIGQIEDHNSRVGSLAWNGYSLTSGARNGSIYNYDYRAINKGKIGEFSFHRKEVCGLKWSANSRYLASGSDDHKVCIWDALQMSEKSGSKVIKPFVVLNKHTAAVKALDWAPWKSNLLATGGGLLDGSIKIWNIYNGKLLESHNSNSQVSGVIWSRTNSELISSHGQNENKIVLWRYPNLAPIGEIQDHSDRILSISLSPNGEIVASLGADQTIRFWECFKTDDKQCFTPVPSKSLLSLQTIR